MIHGFSSRAGTKAVAGYERVATGEPATASIMITRRLREAPSLRTDMLHAKAEPDQTPGQMRQQRQPRDP